MNIKKQTSSPEPTEYKKIKQLYMKSDNKWYILYADGSEAPWKGPEPWN